MKPLLCLSHLTEIAVKRLRVTISISQLPSILCFYAQREAEVNLAQKMGSRSALVLLPFPKTGIIQIVDEGSQAKKNTLCRTTAAIFQIPRSRRSRSAQ